MFLVYIFLVRMLSFSNVKINNLPINAVFSLTSKFKHLYYQFVLVVFRRCCADDYSFMLADSFPVLK